MLIVCFYTIRQMLFKTSLVWLALGITGLFSIGYYIIPIFYQEASGLKNVYHSDLLELQFMSILFFVALILGANLSFNYFSNKKSKAVTFLRLDNFFIKRHKILFFMSFILWLVYFFNGSLTAYSSDNFEDYFHNRSLLDGFLGTFSIYGQAIMAVSTCYAIKEKTGSGKLFIVLYIVVILMSFVSGQRLFVITPLFMLVVALCIYVDYKKSLRLIFLGVLFLMLISPLMVFIREYQSTTSGKEKALSAIQQYDVGNSYVDNALLSLAERADLLSVSAELKDYYEKHTFDHLEYFNSVICSFIPKIVFPNKPYPLSDNGDMSGEASVQAWKIIVGNSTGSLSAFGSITAYREGGWLWVFINGFLSGSLLSIVIYHFSRGGHWATILFISVFVSLTIKNVPTSFFYMIVALAPLFYAWFFLRIANYLFRF